MEKYYKALGLKQGATIEEIQEAYNKLSIELDPINNNNLIYFQIEYKKIVEAYAYLIEKLKTDDLILLDHHKQILERLSKESEIKDESNNKEEFEVENEIIDDDDKLISEEIEEIYSEKNNHNVIKTNTKKESIMKRKNISIKELAFGSILLFIGIGIWGVFLQNLGYFKKSEVAITNDVQNVRVVNTVNSNIEGGKVDVNIQEINGNSNSFYDHNGDKEYVRLPVYTFE
ncbi:MAG: DnaJ domain-containing protein [Bacteroidia bacterium]|nr:DnaJ domain-containing protein [Bacteroidia bacterium]